MLQPQFPSGVTTTTSSGANMTLIFTHFPLNPFKVPEVEGGDQVQEQLDRLHQVGENYLQHLDSQTLTEQMMDELCWCGRSARDGVLGLIDKELAMGDPNQRVDDLQGVLDTLNAYVRDCLKQEYEDEQAQASANQTYQDEG